MKMHLQRMLNAMTWADAHLLAAIREHFATEPETLPLFGHVLAAEEAWLARLESRGAVLPCLAHAVGLGMRIVRGRKRPGIPGLPREAQRFGPGRPGAIQEQPGCGIRHNGDRHPHPRRDSRRVPSRAGRPNHRPSRRSNPQHRLHCLRSIARRLAEMKAGSARVRGAAERVNTCSICANNLALHCYSFTSSTGRDARARSGTSHARPPASSNPPDIHVLGSY